MLRFLQIFILIFAVTSLTAQTNTEITLKQQEKRLQALKDSQDIVIKGLETLKLKWIQEQIQEKGIPEINKDGFLIFTLPNTNRHGG